MLKKVLKKSWATTQDSGLKAGEKSFDGNTEVRHLMLRKGVKCIIIEETSENPTVFLKILILLALKVRDVHLSICPISYKRDILRCPRLWEDSEPICVHKHGTDFKCLL